MPKNLLMTGVPGIGKTTAILRLAEMLTGRALGGFVTEEIRARGKRCGFRLRCFDGTERTLAHIDFGGRRRVGRYGVDVGALEAAVDEALAPGRAELYLVDEIGKMECLSQRFIEAMRHLLAAEAPLVATIALRGAGFIPDVKRRSDVELWEVTLQNREMLPQRALEWLLGSA